MEGPIVAVEAADLERDRRPVARRYLGTEVGDAYVESTRDVVGNVLVRMRPERWLTVDYAKHEAPRIVSRLDHALHLTAGVACARSAAGECAR